MDPSPAEPALPPAGGSPGRVRPGLLLALIVACAALLRALLFTGLQWSDDPGYVLDAWDLAQGRLPLPEHVNGLRILTLAPLAVVLRTFGVHPLAIAAYPLLASLGGVVLAYALGRRLMGPAEGLIAAAVVAVSPLDIALATWMLPDVPLAFLSALAVLLLLRAERSQRAAWAVAGGVAVGACWLIKESGALCFVIPPALAAAAWVAVPRESARARRTALRTAAIAMLAACAVVGMEALVYHVIAGQATYRLQVLRGFYNLPDAGHRYGLVRDLGFYPRAMFLWALDVRAPGTRFYGLTFWFAAAGLVGALWNRRRSDLLIAFWVLGLFLLAQFGTSSLTEYVPFHRLPRHLEMIIIPSALLIALLLRSAARAARLVAVCLAFVLAADGLVAAHGRHRELMVETADIRDILNVVGRLPPKRVYTDAMTAIQLNILTGFLQDDRFLPAERADPETVQDAYVLVGAHRGWAEGAPALGDLPEWVRDPPDAWTRVAVIDAAERGVHASFDPQLWYAPPGWSRHGGEDVRGDS